MQTVLYVVLPALFMALALAAATVFADGAGASGMALAWDTFPAMCGF